MRAREVMNRDRGERGGGGGEREGGREEESSRRREKRGRGNPHTSVKNSLCRESRLALSLLSLRRGGKMRCGRSIG